MRFLWLSLSAVLITSVYVHAQINAETARKRVVIKYSPLPLFDVDNTIQFGLEVPIGNSGFSIQQDLGYGHSQFNVWYREYSEPPVKSTYKSRTHIRYYTFNGQRARAYFGLEYLFKEVVYKENQWVGRECMSGNCSFFENKDFKIGRFVHAGHTRFGWQFYFANRLTMDIFTGLGLRSIRVKTITPGLENMLVSSPGDLWTSSSPGSRNVVLSMVLGAHLGIVLGKFDK